MFRILKKGNTLKPCDVPMAVRGYLMQETPPSKQMINLRQSAYAADFVAWHLLGYVLFQATGLIDYVQTYALPGRYGLVASAFLVVWRVLFLCKDGMSGYSIGKWAFDLRVVHVETGDPIGPVASFKRNLLLLLPIIGELVVWVQMHFGRRWFDGWARSMVIRLVGDLDN